MYGFCLRQNRTRPFVFSGLAWCLLNVCIGQKFSRGATRNRATRDTRQARYIVLRDQLQVDPRSLRAFDAHAVERFVDEEERD
jgi:hypothetical protein